MKLTKRLGVVKTKITFCIFKRFIAVGMTWKGSICWPPHIPRVSRFNAGIMFLKLLNTIIQLIKYWGPASLVNEMVWYWQVYRLIPKSPAAVIHFRNIFVSYHSKVDIYKLYAVVYFIIRNIYCIYAYTYFSVLLYWYSRVKVVHLWFPNYRPLQKIASFHFCLENLKCWLIN